MSGHPTNIDNRRQFLKKLAGLAAAPLGLSALVGCGSNSLQHITGKICGANHKTGHLLRTGNFPAPTEKMNVNVLVAGGGISGLSAMRWLQMNKIEDALLLEMDDTVGGNSISGRNTASAYPWGAHYLPIPDVENKELLDFLHSIGTIKSYDENGLPVYNEYHLCHDPEERLYINGTWQEGLIPQFGIGADDKVQIDRFMKEMELLKTARGNDGKYAFRIPLDESSSDESFRAFDNVSFAQYLETNRYTSKYLEWYLEYCCKDDYGSNLKQTSAWAGLHYFASRQGRAANANSSAVLTWPEGNAFLMNGLRTPVAQQTRSNEMVYAVKLLEDGVEVLCYNTQRKTSCAIHAQKLLLATPQFVTKRLLTGMKREVHTTYAPWMVANVTLKKLPQARGFPLCWDNVIYSQESVGYVYANHQDLHTSKEGVITYYLPIIADDAAGAHNSIYSRTYEEWKQRVVADLAYAHPGIEQHITNIDVWVWGHGMVRPDVGYIWGKERALAMQPIGDRIFFAHTDLSGISIFEEGFYQGINAAKKLVQTT